MKFLCINTVAKYLEIVLYNKGKISYKTDDVYSKASTILMPAIDDILKSQKLELKDLDFFACVIGPGSFTGARIGITTVRAFAQALDKKVIDVTYNQVLSYNVENADTDIITVTDASNGFCYLATFDKCNNYIIPPTVLTVGNELEDFLKVYKKKFILITDTEFENVTDAIKVEKTSNGLINAVLSQHKKGALKNYSELEPLYVRKPQAIIDWEAKNDTISK